MIYLIALIVFWFACNKIEKIWEINREIRGLQQVAEEYRQECQRWIDEDEDDN